MTKYYKVIKENPLWEVGAIISNESDYQQYQPIEDIWNKLKDSSFAEYSQIVQESPDFFLRVYKSPADKLLFLTAEQFKKAFSKKFVK